MKKIFSIFALLALASGCTIEKLDENPGVNVVDGDSDSDSELTETKLLVFEGYDLDESILIETEISEILSKLDEGTSIVVLDNPELSLGKIFVPILNEVALENGVNELYFYNPSSIIASKNEEYSQIISKLQEYNNNVTLELPTFIYIKDGEIIEVNTYSTNSYEGDLSEEEINLLKEEYKNTIIKLTNTEEEEA